VPHVVFFIYLFLVLGAKTAIVANLGGGFIIFFLGAKIASS